MAKIFMLSTLLVLHHGVHSQILRQPIGEAIIDSPQYISDSSGRIESPCQFKQVIESPQIIQKIEPFNFIPQLIPNINIPNSINFPYSVSIQNSIIPNTVIPNAQTVVTDCTPSVCANLANTIQLLIVSNLLKEKLTQDEIVIQPVLNNMLTKCPNLRYLVPNIQNANLKHFNPNFVNPNLANANIFNPNLVNSKVISPHIVNVNRNLVTPNIVTPNQVSSRIVSNNVIPTNIPNNIPNNMERGTLLRALKLLGNDLC